jgi:hypothetical protein
MHSYSSIVDTSVFYGPERRRSYLKGQKVADSDSQLSKTPESFANLQSFKDAISGKSGYNIEVVNDTRMFVAYSPAKILSNTWTVLLMEPYSQVQ